MPPGRVEAQKWRLVVQRLTHRHCRDIKRLTHTLPALECTDHNLIHCAAISYVAFNCIPVCCNITNYNALALFTPGCLAGVHIHCSALLSTMYNVPHCSTDMQVRCPDYRYTHHLHYSPKLLHLFCTEKHTLLCSSFALHLEMHRYASQVLNTAWHLTVVLKFPLEHMDAHLPCTILWCCMCTP